MFGDRENRTLADFRRSGAVEAIAGGAKAEELAHAMGNTLSASNALFATLRADQSGHLADGAGSPSARALKLNRPTRARTTSAIPSPPNPAPPQ